MAAVLLLASRIQADEPRLATDSLRVWDVRPDMFDFVFTSYSEAGDGDWHLAFNDRGGRTYFVSVGDMLGHYRVSGFEPFEEAVHIPELNALQYSKSGRVTLEAPGDTAFTLNQGQWLETGGHRAVIVSLSGHFWSIREGDRFVEGAAAFTLMQISLDAVMVDNDGMSVIISPALPEERTQLAEKWKSEAIALREARAAAATLAEEDEQAVSVKTQQTSARSSAAEFFVGREVRIPSEYGVMFSPDGRGGWLPVVFPRKFQTYYDGVRWGGRGMVIDQPPCFAPSWHLPRRGSGVRAPNPSISITTVP